VDRIDGLTAYPWWHATRAELLHRLDRSVDAAAAYASALALDMSEPQRAHLRRRADAVGPPT
jgi:predicted RNA polymerase sigma factor